MNLTADPIPPACRRDSLMIQPRAFKTEPSSLEPATLEEDDEEDIARPMAILINCDLGHNRSPTLLLAFLLQHGSSLREAYRAVLSSRPSIDPLPAYRRGLCKMELSIRGRHSVRPDEHFGMHISELMDIVGKDFDGLNEALALRETSIKSLLGEGLGRQPLLEDGLDRLAVPEVTEHLTAQGSPPGT